MESIINQLKSMYNSNYISSHNNEHTFTIRNEGFNYPCTNRIQLQSV